MIEQIQGQRIGLRRIKRSDAPLIVRYANDPQVAHNTFIAYPYALKDAYEFMRRSNRDWRKGTGYHLALEDLTTGEFIGGFGFMVISQKHRCIEIGYWLGKKFRGQGLVPEAVKLGLRVAFKELKAMRVQAEVFDGNTSSVRVLEKCGFTFEGTHRKRIKHRGRWRDAMMFSMIRMEWRK
jgi:ribosomal-protein-alanine N-acetyltransferase